jgi:hypothetical protein
MVQLATAVQERTLSGTLAPSAGQKMNAAGFYKTSVYIFNIYTIKVKSKDKGHPRTGHEGS